VLKQMSKTFFVVSVGVAVLALGLLSGFAPRHFGGQASAFASHIDWDARRAEREAEREAQRLEREAERAAENQPKCTCSASLSYAKPSLSFGSSGLVLIPRANVDVRLRGDLDGPKHTIGLHYEGNTAYESDDVAVPGGISFSGDKTLLNNAGCEGRWSFDGVELDRITLPGIVRTLLGAKQELDGNVHLKTAIAGCGFEEENRQFPFTLKEFGNFRVGGWRSVR
jgi:hypothetical protein